jgi:magnesium transporter
MEIRDQYLGYIRNRQWESLVDIARHMHESEIAKLFPALSMEERDMVLQILPQKTSAKIFEYLEKPEQDELLTGLGNKKFIGLLEAMEPDDRTVYLETLPENTLETLLNGLSDYERNITINLLGYPEDSVGRIMTPYYIQVKKTQTVEETLEKIKKRSRKAETLNFLYVVDDQNRLIDDIRIGQVLMASEGTRIGQLMDNRFAYLQVDQKVEDAISVFKQFDRSALPVVTKNMKLVGIVTSDDILDVIEREDTEDIQKFGGMKALDLPYVNTSLLEMVKKRAGWLVILFVGEMLTATAMGVFEDQIAKAVVLALFVPLIISSGGNSGSQAATLIIRAMALKELMLKDWWLVMRKEIFSGFFLGSILGLVGFLRIFLWQHLHFFDYSEHWFLVAITIGFTLIGIVMWGTLSGSMIPFILRKFGLDPATSSAPFVATLVDVTGIIIYFSLASVILAGTLL